MYTLVFLRDLDLPPLSEPARAAVDLVRQKVTGSPWHGESPFFESESELCINGRVLALAAYFGIRSDRLAQRLIAEHCTKKSPERLALRIVGSPCARFAF